MRQKLETGNHELSNVEIKMSQAQRNHWPLSSMSCLSWKADQIH